MKTQSTTPKRVLSVALCVGAVSLALGQDEKPETRPGAPGAERPIYSQPGRASTLPHATTPEQFAQEAAASGWKEIRLSQMAVQKAQNSEVRQLAQKIVQDHTQMNQQLTQIAQKKGFTLPSTNLHELGKGISSAERDYARERATESPDLDRAQPEREPLLPGATQPREQVRGLPGQPGIQPQDDHGVQRLESLTGAEFDRSYVHHMVQGHAQSVQKFEQASQNLQDQELKQFATESLPKLREHQQMAQQLAQKLGGAQDNPFDSELRRNEPSTQPRAGEQPEPRQPEQKPDDL